MWLTSSSIGRKLIMSVTGAALILFLTFHALMNGVAIISPAAYNVVCEMLGANWYALVASMGLALLFIIHIIYALVLTIENRKARGNDRYAVNVKPAGVEWSSQNMLVLGFVVIAFIGLHLWQFWAKMQLAELTGSHSMVDGVYAAPAAGTLYLQMWFSQPWVVACYIIGFIALWFHMTHGFWSMFQTAGWDNDIWIKRLKCIGNWWVSLVVGLFLLEAVVFTAMAMCSDKPYVNCPQLKEQYVEMEAAFNGHADDNAVCPAEAATEAVCPAACDNTPCAAQKCNASCEKATCQNPAECPAQQGAK